MNTILTELNILDAFKKTPAPRDYVFPAFPKGKVGLLASPGGTGKSFFALQACFQVAAGHYCDFGLSSISKHNEPARVMYISLEDQAEDLESRLNALWCFYKNKKDHLDILEQLAAYIHIYPLAGKNAVLFNEKCEETVVFSQIKEAAAEMTDLRLIIVDTLRRSHDGDENSNSYMSALLRKFEALAASTGAAVLLLHHESKAGMNDSDAGASAVRGASAIVDNSRYVMRLKTMTPKQATKLKIDEKKRRDFICATVEKSNYGPPQAEKWLERKTGGILQDADLDNLKKGF